MTRKKLVVLDGYALNPGDLSWDEFRGLVDIEVHPRTPPGQVVERSRGAELLMTNKTPVRAAAFAELDRLEYIGVLATGYDIVDVAAARGRGVVVSNVPTYGTASVAQFVFALALELCHHVQYHSDIVRAGEWTRSPDWCFWRHPLIELAGKTLGVIGFGRIGRQTARIGDALGMRVLAADPLRANAPGYDGFRWAEVDEVLAEADVVSLHCPLTPDTRGLVDARRIALMKPTAFLINTARGPLVNVDDLAAALNAGRIAGAALDVLPLEPPPADSPLFTAANCILTPHIAWATREARARLMQVTLENLRAFLAGEPVNVVS